MLHKKIMKHIMVHKKSIVSKNSCGDVVFIFVGQKINKKMQQVLKLEILKATLAVLLITTGVIITALWRRLRKQSKSLLHKRIPPGNIFAE